MIRILLLCSICFFPFFLSGAEPEKAPRTLAQETAEIFELIAKESPLLSARLEEIPRTELLQILFRALDTGIVPAKGTPPEPDTNSDLPAPYPAKLIASNTVFYARLEYLGASSLYQLKEDLTQSARLPNQPLGVILDLRNATAEQSKWEFVEPFLKLFQSGDGKTFQFRVPLAVLCSGKTSGAPELLALLLEQNRHGMTMGATTAGNPFPLKEIRFHDTLWSVPVIGKEEWKKILPEPHTPLIVFEPFPQIPFAEIGKKPATSDHAIRRAADLLRSLHAVRDLLK